MLLRQVIILKHYYEYEYEYRCILRCFNSHLNSMGAGVGAKNADPNMKIVMAGLGMLRSIQ